MKKEIKAVFLDMDGTLFDLKNHKVTQENITALRQAKENGVLIFIATGRHCGTPSEAKILSPLLDSLTGIVSANGQHCCLMDGTQIFRHDLDHEDFSAIADMCRKNSFPLLYSDTSMTYVTLINERVIGFNERMQIPLPPLRALQSQDPPMMKASVYISAEEEAQFLVPILHHSSTTRWCKDLVDLTPMGIGKETGIAEMGHYFGFDLDQVMAIGDGGNDISMLKAVGTGVAMGNAAEDVRSAANYVTGCCEESGVTQAFRHFGVI